MGYTPQTWVDNNASFPVSATRMTHMDDGLVDLDKRAPERSQVLVVNNESGATLDDKIETALAYIATLTGSTQTRPALGFLPNTDGTPLQWNSYHELFDGVQLVNLGRYVFQNEPRSNSHGLRFTTTRVGGQWGFAAADTVHSMGIDYFEWLGTSSTDWYDADSSDLFQMDYFKGGGFSGYRSVLGRNATKLITQGGTIGGFWNINNVREDSLVWGGSDAKLIPEQLLIDSNPSTTPMTSAPNGYMVRFDWLEKTIVKHLYITAERNRAMRILGPAWGSFGSHQGHLVIADSIIEGRNEDEPGPAYGELVRIQGGGGFFRGVWFGYAMYDPSLITANTARGVVAVEGGNWEFKECTYRPAVARTASITTTSGSTSVTGTFTSADVNRMITGTGIANGTYIVSQTGSAAVLSQNASGSGTNTMKLYVEAPFIWVGSAARCRVSNITPAGDMWGTGATPLKPKVYVQSGANFDADNSVTVVNI